MATSQVSNCKKCGKMFVKRGSDLCPNCLKDIEEDYQKCADYLHNNKLVNIYDLSEATKVPVPQITQFIREGRISVANNPNLGYPCDSCGKLITKGRLCDKCTTNLHKGIERVNDVKSSNFSGRESKINKTYYSINNRINKK